MVPASRFGVVAVVAMLLLGSCRASEPRPEDRFTACDLISRAEMARILERPVTKPAESADAATDTLAGRSGCAWSSVDEQRAVLIELVRTKDMSSSVRRTGFSAAARFEALRGDHPDAPAPEVPGARTIYVETAASLHVLAGSNYLTIEVAATPPTTVQPIAVSLARAAVARLRRAERAD